MSKQPRRWTDEQLYEALEDWIVIHERIPLSDEWKRSDDSHPSYQTIWHRFGSWIGFLKSWESHRKHKKWTRESIIQSFQDWNERYGKTPTIRDAHTVLGFLLPSDTTVVRAFGSWNKGIEEAGFFPVGRGLTRQAVAKYLPMPRKAKEPEE